jgi:hypothetical protein
LSWQAPIRTEENLIPEKEPQKLTEDLIQAIHSSSKAKRLEAIQLVRKGKIKELLPELRITYEKERHVEVKREFLKAFADLGGESAVECLRDALLSTEPELRLEAARRLARIKPLAAKPDLIRILEGDDWDLIRLVVPACEPPYGTKDDIPLLLTVVQKAANPTIRYLALHAMNSIQQGEWHL